MNSLNNILTVGLLSTVLIAYRCTEEKGMEYKTPARIISLAPSITETLFALGLGEKIVGVTTYCTYPPQTAHIEKIGGFSDANLEKIIVLHPDLVILLREHEKQRIYLERFAIRTLTVDNSTCASLCTTFAHIGRFCGKTEAADSLIRLFQELKPLKTPDQSQHKKVLFCIGRDAPGKGSIQTIYAAGRATFYNELIEAAGGINAFPDSIPQYPRLSIEGIIAVSPDVIIDAASAMSRYPCSLLVKDWQTVVHVPAVKNSQVYCMSEDYVTVPGPRVLLLLKDIQKLLTTLPSSSLQ